MKALLLANTDWYLFNFRLPLARSLRAQGVDVVLVSPPGPYAKRLEAAGFRYVPLAMNRLSIDPVEAVQVIRSLARIYRDERPDVVHHFTIKCVIYGSYAARLAGIGARLNAVAGLGYVFSSSGARARILRPLVKALLRHSLRGRMSRLIVQNADDARRFVAEGLAEPDSTRLIRGSGVDTRRFAPVSRFSRGGSTIVLMATRLLWDKGIREFVNAARLCRAAGEDVRFLLAGMPDPGNPASVTVEHVSRWDAEGIIKPLGHVENMSALLREVDIVVLPTTYGEGVPRILLEAAASGLPIIAAEVPGCREIVRPGINGLLVIPRNARKLADAIRQLHQHPELRVRMGRAGRDLAIREFDERRVLRSTLDVYREVVPIPATVERFPERRRAVAGEG